MPAPKSIAQIAAELQGYDPQALSAVDVSHFLSQLVQPVQDVLELPLFESLGRVLAADVVSPFDVPPHDNSAMDGYAFAGAVLAAGKALTLKVVGTALAGKAWQGTVRAGECVKIMTGAIMPAGLDTVVPQEFVAVQADSITLPAKLLRPGDNHRMRGEDLMQGHPALLKGELLTPARLGLAASLGLKTVATRRPLRVAYFSTGDEILSLGEAPREGAVYDSNRYTVFGMLRRLGCEVIDMGVVRDDPALLEAAFTCAAAQADAIITSGGVSVGEADYTKAMMKKLGDVAFWRIAMRPGRPMAVGRISQAKSASSPMGTSASSSQNSSKSNGDSRFAAGPPQGETAPSGGSEPHQVVSVGADMRSAGRPQASTTPSGGSEPHEVGSVRADVRSAGPPQASTAPSGGSEPHEVGSVGADMRSAGPPQASTAPSRGSEPHEVGSVRADVRSAGPPQASTAPSGGSEPHEVGSVGAILFGLPGNPVAVMVTFLAFVRPALLQMMGCTDPAPPLLKARSLEPMRKKPGRTEYQRGWVSTAADGSLQVRTTGNQGSGVLSSMAQANGLIVLHHDQGNVAPGDEVDVMMFDGVI